MPSCAGFYSNMAAAGEVLSKLPEQSLDWRLEFAGAPGKPALYLPGEQVELAVQWDSRLQAEPEGVQYRVVHASRPNDILAPIRIQLSSRAHRSEVWTAHGKRAPHHYGQTDHGEGNLCRTHLRPSGFATNPSSAPARSSASITTTSNSTDKPLAVIGTTYMSSEVQRLYFEHPNVYIWNQDLAPDSRCRTQHDPHRMVDRLGQILRRERPALRAHAPHPRGLSDDRPQIRPPGPIQLLRISPRRSRRRECLPGSPSRSQTASPDLAVVARFHDVPFLAWDLINEPSFSKHFWTSLPNHTRLKPRSGMSGWTSTIQAVMRSPPHGVCRSRPYKERFQSPKPSTLRRALPTTAAIR